MRHPWMMSSAAVTSLSDWGGFLPMALGPTRAERRCGAVKHRPGLAAAVTEVLLKLLFSASQSVGIMLFA